MTELIKKFSYSARWNAFESIFYKAILTIHQTCLFYFSNKLIYGLSSFIFAIIYLSVELINLGFDRSIAQFSQIYFHNPQFFKRYFLPQVIFQLALLITLSLFAFQFDWLNLILQTTHAQLHWQQTLLILVIIVCEALRKTFRTVAQLLFLNKASAYLELSLITIYTSLFWLSIWFGYQVNIYTIYFPLLIQSLIGLIGLLCLIATKLRLNFALHEQKLLEQPKPSLSFKQIYYYRTQNYLYQISEMPFSSNFLIYFLSTIIGLVNIGPVKLANYFAVFIKALLDKTFGLTSLALFAKNKGVVESQKTIFAHAQSKLNAILICLILIFSACSLIVNATNSTATTSYLAILFLIFALINNFFIVYEQLFLVYNKIITLFLLNLACMLVLVYLYITQPGLLTALNIVNVITILALLRALSLFLAKLKAKNIFT